MSLRTVFAVGLLVVAGCTDSVPKAQPAPRVSSPALPASSTRSAAEAEDPLAGAIALEREGTPKSLRAARAIYAAACRQGSARACYHYEEATHTTGMRGAPAPPHTPELERLCEKEDHAACYELALTLDDSGGLPKDGKRAFELFNRACDGGYVFACDGVAEYYLVSFPSAERDAEHKALRYAWRACQAGRGGSCNLARMANPKPRPEGVPAQDELNELGCRHGNIFNCTLLAEAAEPGMPFACDQCAPGIVGSELCDQCQAAADYDQHCCPTCPERATHAACADPELLTRHPAITPPLPEETVKAANAKLHAILDPVVAWLEPSCERGHVAACGDLGVILGKAKWPVHDAERSAKLLERACTHGSGNACAKLADAAKKRGDVADAQRLRARATRLFQRKCAIGAGDACWAAMDPTPR